jgi:8-oxo-dGTP pyrophosphatase MutT (NUDIX family)
VHVGEGLGRDPGRDGVSIDPGDVPEGTWVARGDTVIYDSDWVRLVTTDVVLPDGTQVDHHVVRMPAPASGVIIVRDGAVLLQYRHRFITDTWGWEIPAGRVDPGETPAEAAIREAAEESGWRPRTVDHLCTFHPANGLLDQSFHIFVSRDAVHLGEPEDRNEATEIAWFGPDDVRARFLGGEINDGLSFGAVGYALAAGAI